MKLGELTSRGSYVVRRFSGIHAAPLQYRDRSRQTESRTRSAPEADPQLALLIAPLCSIETMTYAESEAQNMATPERNLHIRGRPLCYEETPAPRLVLIARPKQAAVSDSSDEVGVVCSASCLIHKLSQQRLARGSPQTLTALTPSSEAPNTHPVYGAGMVSES